MPTELVCVRIESEDLSILKDKAWEKKMSFSAFCRQILGEYIDNDGLQEPTASSDGQPAMAPTWQTNPVTVRDYHMRYQDAAAAAQAAKEAHGRAEEKKKRALRDYNNIWELEEKRRRGELDQEELTTDA